MTDTFEVLIIGAGIVGSACACELAASGLQVGVLECDEVGSGATAAGMGHIVVMDDSPAQQALTRYGQLLWDAEVRAAHAAHEYLPCGTIWVADAQEVDAVEEKRDTYRAHGIPCDILDAQALYALEPQLRPGLAAGLLVPGDSVVYPPRSAAVLLARAQDQGARLIQGRATALEPDGARLTNNAQVKSRVTVLANGARSVDLAPELPIQPKKGHLAITDRASGFVRHQLVELGYLASAHAADGESVAFNVQPRGTGQVLIGSSRQPGVATAAVDFPILARMLARACAYLPALQRMSCLRVWTGLRAATPDNLPLIGPWPRRPGVWLATGHEGLGITTALATARLLAAQLCGRVPEIPIAPYLAARLIPETADAP